MDDMPGLMKILGYMSQQLAHILHSNVLESTIQSLGPSMNTVHNPYEHLLVRAYGVIEHSCVKSSTLVNVSAYDSNIEFSDVKRVTPIYFLKNKKFVFKRSSL